MTQGATWCAASDPGWRCSSAGKAPTCGMPTGRRYLDFLAGIAVNSLGHAHPVFVEAIANQAATLAHVSNYFATPPQLELASRLKRLAGTGDSGRVYFGNSGAEANEAAFKLARLHGAATNGGAGRPRVLALTDAFHGRTMGTLALTGKPYMQEPFLPMVARRRIHRLHDRGARSGTRRPGRGAVRRADQGRGGRDRSARGLPRGGARTDRGARRAADHRRDPDRRGAHRGVVRLPARGHHPRRDHGREGHRRRVPDRSAHHVRCGERAVLSGNARLDLRGQRPRHRRLVGGARRDRGRRARAQRRRAGSPAARCDRGDRQRRSSPDAGARGS